MPYEVTEWFYDGHKILAVLDGDQVCAEVKCPGKDHSPLPRLKCGRGGGEPKGAAGICVVEEFINEYGWEMNCTALKFMIQGLLPIEYGFLGGEEFYFKVAGYPSEKEASQFRQEAIDDLLVGPASSLTMPRSILQSLPLRPWSKVDQEVKDSLRQDIKDHLEEMERKNA